MQGFDQPITDMSQPATANRPDKVGKEDVFPIDPALLATDRDRSFDVYLLRGNSLAVHIPARKTLSVSEQEGLANIGENALFVLKADRSAFYRFAEDSILRDASNEGILLAVRVGLLYDLGEAVIDDVMADPAQRLHVKRAVKVADRIREMIVSIDGALAKFVTTTRYDKYLSSHAVNVCVIGTGIGRAMELDELDLRSLSIGCMLHDIGMAAVPASIRSKEGKLSQDEWDAIKRHPEAGVRLLQPMRKLIGEDALIPVAQHHEKMNGSGYPKGLSSNWIHRFGRIAGVADMFAAMTANRAYADAMESFPALKTIKEENWSQVDPAVFKHLVLMLSG